MLRPRTYRSSPRASQHIQYRRNSGSRPEPLLSPLIVEGIVNDGSARFAEECFALRITNKNRRGVESDDPYTAAQRIATGQNSRSPPSTWVYCSSMRRCRSAPAHLLPENTWRRNVEETHKV